MIVAVKDGAVAEIGTHDELMEKGGVYKQLVELQVTQGVVYFVLLSFKLMKNLLHFAEIIIKRYVNTRAAIK